MTGLYILLSLNAFRRRSVDHSEHAPAQIGLGDDHLHRVRRGAENIADFGGITLAYYAYIAARDRSERAGKEQVQDIRRFFLGFASVWRESVRIEALRNSVLSDVHAPGRFRVNGTLFNMPEFYEAFPEIPPENRFFRTPEQRPVIW